jgi:uncharacterized protein YdeI (YjbR/CyaY-like superfamily)
MRSFHLNASYRDRTKKMNSRTDGYFEKLEMWQKESKKLRTILSGFPLEEELKWGQPCYTIDSKNIVLIGGFKDYCTLLFFKGALMSDPEGILVAPGATQAGRQIRFTSLPEINAMEDVVKRYIADAIRVEQAGLKVKLKAHSDYEVPEELKEKLKAMPKLKKAFESLTPVSGPICYLSLHPSRQRHASRA